MVFLKSYTPKSLVDALIQYDYAELHQEFRRVARNKTLGRMTNSTRDPRLTDRVNDYYDRVDLTEVPLKWVKVWNMLHYPHKGRVDIQPVRNLLEEIEEPNIVDI